MVTAINQSSQPNYSAMSLAHAKRKAMWFTHLQLFKCRRIVMLANKPIQFFDTIPNKKKYLGGCSDLPTSFLHVSNPSMHLSIYCKNYCELVWTTKLAILSTTYGQNLQYMMLLSLLILIVRSIVTAQSDIFQLWISSMKPTIGNSNRYN